MKRYFLPFLIVALCGSPLFAQEIILLNQDGEKVGVAKGVQDKPEIKADAIVVKPGDGKDSATIENGVIKVIGPDGKIQEFKLSDAKSVTITRSSKTVVGDDGEQKVEKRGKAILIGPDGVRREIDLGSGGLGGSVTESKIPKTWMIGVTVKPVSDVIRAQLRLDEGVGLVVQRVLQGGAAEVGGLKANDILMFGDQKPIGDRKQLSEVVNEAGADGNDVVFTILRGGEEVSVTVKPTEREGVRQMRVAIPGFDLGRDLDLGPEMDFEFRQFGPGIIIGEGGADAAIDVRELHSELMGDLEEKIRKMREEMEEMRQRMREDK